MASFISDGANGEKVMNLIDMLSFVKLGGYGICLDNTCDAEVCWWYQMKDGLISTAPYVNMDLFSSLHK